MVDNYHASGLFTGFSISDVANQVTISIGGTSKTLNLVRAFPSGVGNNFNDIATHGNSMGMSNIAAPYASSTANYQTLNGYVNPNGHTGWHHYINLSYTDSNNTATSPNMWQTQFAIKAGTTEVYVRSRAGGKISNNAAWAAPWVRLARVTDNVASASKVANARTIWGQSFDGTANVSGSITGVNNITMSNNSYLYGKNTSGTAIQLIAMASWNSIDIGRGALTYGYTTQVMGKTVAFTASDDSGKNTKSMELSTAKFYSNVTIETEKGLFANGGVTAYSSSDIRLKQNLCKLDYLNIIKAMGGSYGFTWRKDNKHSIGWIAQHVLNNPYMNDIVETDENGYYKINYWSPKLIATAFGAIEQVDDEISKLKARVIYLESEVERLTNDNKLLMNK